jgi:hypothetical protein
VRTKHARALNPLNEETELTVQTSLDQLLEHAIAQLNDPMVKAFLLAIQQGDSAPAKSTVSKVLKKKSVGGRLKASANGAQAQQKG